MLLLIESNLPLTLWRSCVSYRFFFSFLFFCAYNSIYKYTLPICHRSLPSEHLPCGHIRQEPYDIFIRVCLLPIRLVWTPPSTGGDKGTNQQPAIHACMQSNRIVGKLQSKNLYMNAKNWSMQICKIRNLTNLKNKQIFSIVVKYQSKNYFT
jgi:hypothetical protein